MYKSLKRLGIKVKLVGISEIDVDAIKSYDAIHNNKVIDIKLPTEEEIKHFLLDRNIGYNFKKKKSTISRWKSEKLVNLYKACIALNNYGDISKINPSELPDFDLFNFSFPCTDISVAGQQQGMKDEKGGLTRSGMYIYGMNIIKAKRPKYIMIENVKNLVGKKFKVEFDEIVQDLESNNYNVYWKVLNAKDFGIPQNRERVFAICVRKDIDNGKFEFPIGFSSDVKLKDMLEQDVDEKFYLNEKYQQRFEESLSNRELQKRIPKTGVYEVIGTTVNPEAKGTNSRHWVYNTDKVIGTIDATTYKQPKQILIKDFPKAVAQRGRYLEDGSIEQKFEVRKDDNTNTITSVQKDNMVAIVDDLYRNREKRFYKNFVPALRADRQGLKVMELEDILESDAKLPILHNIYGGFNEKEPRIFNNYSPTIRTAAGGGHIPSVCTTDEGRIEKIVGQYKIRKLTPMECWRLMGFDDDDFYKAKRAGVSDTQLYRQAGNSIVVNVLEAIFKNLFNK